VHSKHCDNDQKDAAKVKAIMKLPVLLLKAICSKILQFTVYQEVVTSKKIIFIPRVACGTTITPKTGVTT
jgi:cephalosporin-C deacetylase-like acetyl esterase